MEDIKKELEVLKGIVMQEAGQKAADLVKEIETRLEKANGQIQDGNKVQAELKSELSNLVQKYNDLQKGYDALDVKLQKQGMGTQQVMETTLADVLTKYKSELAQVRENGRFFSLNGEREKSLGKFLNLMDTKATTVLTSTNLTGDVVTQQLIPGIIYDPERPVHVRQALSVSPTSAGEIRYVVESAIENNTDVRAEGATYPQSDFELTQ